MYAVEFQTTIKNGVIEIPVEYQGQLKQRVRVILLAEDVVFCEISYDRFAARPGLPNPGLCAGI